MQVINCPHCKNPVPNTTIECPHCGYDVKTHLADRAQRKHAENVQRQVKILEDRKRAEVAQAEITRNQTEPQRQYESVVNLDKEIKTCKQRMLYCWLSILVSGLLFYLSVVIRVIFLAYLTVGIAIVSYCIFLYYLNKWRCCSADKRLAATDYRAYEKVLDERKESELRHQAHAEKERQLAHPKCPHCGSTYTRRIGNINRATSVAFWGLASSKIGKQYECRSCNHKW